MSERSKNSSESRGPTSALRGRHVPDKKSVFEEYKFLRTEIEAIWSQTYTALNFLLAFIGAMIVTAMSKDMGQYGRLILLSAASSFSYAGYKVIYVHSGRVWRVTTYMRCALEPILKDIAWETRLWTRYKSLKPDGADAANESKSQISAKALKGTDPVDKCQSQASTKQPDPIDKGLFDAHQSFLHIVNGVILVLMAKTAWSLCGRHLPPCWAQITSWLACVIPPTFCLIPIAVLLRVRYKHSIMRGGKLEKDQYDNWRTPVNDGSDTVRIFETIPKFDSNEGASRGS